MPSGRGLGAPWLGVREREVPVVEGGGEREGRVGSKGAGPWGTYGALGGTLGEETRGLGCVRLAAGVMERSC